MAALIGLAAAALGAALWRAEVRLTQRHQVEVQAVRLPSDAASLARGKYLYGALGCAGCHRDDGAGQVLWSADANVLRTSHIAPGKGSATAGYSGADWVRAVRHGIGGGGRALLAMPSVDFQRLSDADLGAVAAYIGRLAPVESTGVGHRLGLLMRVLVGVGRIPLAPDHLLPGVAPQASVTPSVTIEHGRYVAMICVGCHGPQLNGGPIRGMPPGTPAAANLTPAADGAMLRYPTPAEFRNMLQSGRRPDGRAIAVMPFPSLARLDQVDCDALHLYLKSLPAVATGVR